MKKNLLIFFVFVSLLSSVAARANGWTYGDLHPLAYNHEYEMLKFEIDRDKKLNEICRQNGRPDYCWLGNKNSYEAKDECDWASCDQCDDCEYYGCDDCDNCDCDCDDCDC